MFAIIGKLFNCLLLDNAKISYLSNYSFPCLFNSEVIDVHREPPPKPPAHAKDKEVDKNNSIIEDNEPLYDSVCSDDDYGELTDVRTPPTSDPPSQESTGNGKDTRTQVS